ncbi:GNAT family N-acetyltransferase [Nocardia wallacei]|uniref:GNAT family N-acetyltransferase n=1 Tax=Nocardia wallacei TaxID=480035 RepID=UPI0016576297|nr:GNAT family N-acetyltransferase [Nocardia wallacei]
MEIRVAGLDDVSAFSRLASQVEHWFGPMVGEPEFQASVRRIVGRATALVAVRESDIVGGLLFGGQTPVFHIRWLVVAEAQRGKGIGGALVAEARKRFVRTPATIEVITFGSDHPGAALSGARRFYEGLGFVPAETAAPGPEGGARQVFRMILD